MSERININQDKTEVLGSKSNMILPAYENNLIPSRKSSNTKLEKENPKEILKDNEKEVVNSSIKKSQVKKQKTDIESPNNSKSSSKRNKRAFKGDIDSYSANRSLLIMEELY